MSRCEPFPGPLPGRSLELCGCGGLVPSTPSSPCSGVPLPSACHQAQVLTCGGGYQLSAGDARLQREKRNLRGVFQQTRRRQGAPRTAVISLNCPRGSALPAPDRSRARHDCSSLEPLRRSPLKPHPRAHHERPRPAVGGGEARKEDHRAPALPGADLGSPRVKSAALRGSGSSTCTRRRRRRAASAPLLEATAGKREEKTSQV